MQIVGFPVWWLIIFRSGHVVRVKFKHILYIVEHDTYKLRFCVIDRSKAILLLWFNLLYVLESIFVLFEPYVRFHILFKFG